MNRFYKGPSPSCVDYQFEGPGSRDAYFEGWYFKFSLDQSTTISLIPSLHKKGGQTLGNLQWLLVKDGSIFTRSVQFPAAEVSVRKSPFSLRLGPNLFTGTGIRIREADMDVEADFTELRPFARDIMGPFRPLHRQMPCSHGLLVTNGLARLSIRSPHLSGAFTSRLYVEKDWGDTFPERYIWIHADFPGQNNSFFFSIARVEVGPAVFPGFIANLVLDGTDHTFATWNMAQCRVTGDPSDIRVSLAKRDMRLTLRIRPQQSVHLKSPVEGLMGSTIRESLAAPLQMVIEDKMRRITRFSTGNASVEHHDWFDELSPPL